jgi:LysM repeat protein
VRPGDTLLGIALDFGLSVDDLRAANAGIDPLALQVGQIIIIPPPRTTVALIFTPVPLTLDPPICQHMITSGLLCLGQVHNPFDQPLSGVRIALTLLAADSTPLHQITTGLEQTLIPPHASAPYSAILPTDALNRVMAAVLSAHLVDQPSNATQLDIVAEQMQVEQNRYRVIVTLRNASDQPTGPARLILTVVDADNQVVGLRVVNSPTGFEAAAEQTLHIEALTRAANGPLRHTLYVETQPAR